MAPYFGRAGELVRGPSGEMLAICADHRALVLELLQLEGRGAVPAAEMSAAIGSMLGD